MEEQNQKETVNTAEELKKEAVDTAKEVKEAVKNNLGVTIISSLIANSSNKNKELKIIPLDNHFTRNFSYVLPNNITHSKVNDLFINEFKKFVLLL